MRPSSIVRAPFVIVRHLWMLVVTYMPGWLGNDLRLRHYRRRFKRCGRNVTIDQGVLIDGAELISVGDDVHIDKNCIIVGSPPDFDLSHRALKKKPLEDSRVAPGEVRIGRECHISQNCMIYGYGGVFLGDNCVMSAGAPFHLVWLVLPARIFWLLCTIWRMSSAVSVCRFRWPDSGR